MYLKEKADVFQPQNLRSLANSRITSDPWYRSDHRRYIELVMRMTPRIGDHVQIQRRKGDC